MNILGHLGRWLQKKFPDKMSVEEVNAVITATQKEISDLKIAKEDFFKERDLLRRQINEQSLAMAKIDNQLHTLEVQQTELLKRTEEIKIMKDDILKIKSLELVRQKVRKMPDFSDAYKQ